MADPNQQPRTDIDMIRWTDGELVHLLGRRYLDISPIGEFDVSRAEGLKEGVGALLRTPVDGELPEGFSVDGAMMGMIVEVRTRISQRFGHSGAETNG